MRKDIEIQLIRKSLDKLYTNIVNLEKEAERRRQLWNKLTEFSTELTYNDLQSAIAWLEHSSLSAEEILKKVVDKV